MDPDSDLQRQAKFSWCTLRDAPVTTSLFNPLAQTCYWLPRRVGTQHWQGVSHSHPMEHPGSLQLLADVSNMVPSHCLRNRKGFEKKKQNYLQFFKSNTGLLPRLISLRCSAGMKKVSHGNGFIREKLTITVWEQKAATAPHKLARDCDLLNYRWEWENLRLVYIWSCFTGFLQPLSTCDRSFLWFDRGRKEETSTLHGSGWVDRFYLLIVPREQVKALSQDFNI